MTRLDRKPAELAAIAGMIVQLLAAALALWFGYYSGAATAKVLGWAALIGAPVSLMALLSLRLNRLAEAEQEEWERLKAEREAGGARGALFEEDEIQAFAARNRLRILEKYIGPIFSLAMVLALAGIVVGMLALGTVANSAVIADRAFFSLAFFFAMGFVLFLMAMYAAGMSRQAAWRPARAVGSYLMLSTLLSLAAVVAYFAGSFKYENPDRILAYCALGLMTIILLESLLNFVLDFYRPRVGGVEARPAYDSRLLGLLSQPGGVFKTIAATLDYQFGFRVSQTWFYRFLEQAIAPLLLFQLLTLYGLSCFVIVGPEQQGVLERFGKYVRTVPPGLCMKWPWPVENVCRFPANEVKIISLGHSGARTVAEDQKDVWTVKHYEKEFDVMVGATQTGLRKSDVPVVNLLVAAATVRYKISDVYKWHYESVDAEKLVDAIANREVNKYFAGRDIFTLMGPGRMAAAEELKKRMNTELEPLGATVLGVGLEEVHPPVEGELPRAFHGLITAVTQNQIDYLNAEAQAKRVLNAVQGDAAAAKYDAQEYYTSRIAGIEGAATRFQAQAELYALAGDVFKMREFMAALQDGLTDVRKYVLAVRKLDREHLRLNLEDPLRTSIESLGDFQKVETGEPSPKK